MNKEGPIIIVDDDADERHILAQIFRELAYPNQVLFFIDGEAAFEFLSLNDIDPFLILADVNMPKLDGFQLRNEVMQHPSLRFKCIPYMLLSTSAEKATVLESYNQSMHGYIHKPKQYEDMKKAMAEVVEYWSLCGGPAAPVAEMVDTIPIASLMCIPDLYFSGRSALQ